MINMADNFNGSTETTSGNEYNPVAEGTTEPYTASPNIEMAVELFQDNPDILNIAKQNIENPDDFVFVKGLLDLAGEGEGINISAVMKQAAIHMAPEASARIGQNSDQGFANIVADKLREQGQENFANIIQDSHFDQDELRQILADEGHKIKATLDPQHLDFIAEQLVAAYPDMDPVDIEGLAAAEVQLDIITKTAVEDIKNTPTNMPFNTPSEGLNIPENSGPEVTPSAAPTEEIFIRDIPEKINTPGFGGVSA